jgi:hypothetical protein
MRAVLVAACGVAAVAPAVLAGDEDQAAMMAAYMEKMQPGPAHAMLAQLVGDWAYTITSYENPEQPMTMTGESTKKMVMGGRYLEETTSGEMMGMPFEGVAITGFDNTSGEFQSIWFDNMSTGMMMAEGPFAEGAPMVMMGEYTNPMTGDTQNVKMVTEIVDADNHTFKWITVGDDGTETTMMEIAYVRKM